MNSSVNLDSPLGNLAVMFKDGRLYSIDIGKPCPANKNEHDSSLRQLQTELQAYFSDKPCRFSIPLALEGTPFQRRVWHALQNIPLGETLTYGQLAKQLHSSPRAVGNACRANPVPIVVPCHRVLAKQGLGGYDGQTSGQRLDIKRWLLRHEGVHLE